MKIRIVAALALMFLFLIVMGSAALAAIGIGQVHLVKSGDTLWRIIQKEYGIDDPKITTFLIRKVAETNLMEADKIRPGDKILFPALSSLLGAEIEMEEEEKNEQAELTASSPAAKTGLTLETLLPKMATILSFLSLISLSIVLLFFFFRKGRIMNLPLKIGSSLGILAIMLFANFEITSSGASFDVSDFRYSTRELSYNSSDGAPSKEIQLEKEKDELAEKRAELYKSILTIYYVRASSEAAEEDEWLKGWLGTGDLFKHRIIPVGEREQESEAFDKYLKSYEPMEERSYYRHIDKYRRELIGICKKYGISPPLLKSLMWVESRGNPEAVSPAGAIGLLQLMPDTAKIVFGIENPDELFDVSVNIELGSRYLLLLWERFQNLEKALAGYNWGPGNVRQRGVPERIRKNFIKPVLWSAEIFSRPMLKNANYFDLFLWQKT